MNGRPRAARLIHLSDLHFGTQLPELAPLVHAEIDRYDPSLVVVSGDFTQTAVAPEFEEAKAFLDAIRHPVFAVPGNHDIPRYDLWERFADPYRRYRRFIARDLEPVWRENGICVAGINTARRILPHWNWANGMIDPGQVRRLGEIFSRPAACRICVMHHPVWKVREARLDVVVFGGRAALKGLDESRVDLVLSGHVHHAGVYALPRGDGRKTVFLSASTALSRRLRAQKNGFNVVDLYEDRMIIEIRGYVGGRFDTLERHEHSLLAE